MAILQILIFFDALKVPTLRKEVSIENSFTLFLAFISTVISILLSVYIIWAESKGLRENSMDHILLSMKAK